MASLEMVLGHETVGDIEVADFIMPKNLENSYWAITTLWNSEKKYGQTIKIFMPSKSYWDLKNNPPVMLGKHKSMKKAFDFHNKMVKKIRESDNYC